MNRTVVDLATGEVTSVALTPQEVAALPPAPAVTVPTVAQQIEALEREHAMSLQRANREVMLAVMEKEAAAAGITPEQLRQVNPGYRRVKLLDEQIAALRAQL